MKEKIIEKVNRKSMIIRPSGRSTDFISPSFGYGCLLNCTYCYMKRHKPEGLHIANNTNDILTAINNHAYFESTVDKPNQTDDTFITYDISCNEDFALHSRKYHEWKKIFTFFKEHPIAKASLATKIVPSHFLDFNPNRKVRIRFSLMPETIAEILEPDASSIVSRIVAIEEFLAFGYDVHINFSPVIIYDGWEKDYRDLFRQIDYAIFNKALVKSEVIFLTHNVDKHNYNINNKLNGEHLIWNPSIQEDKVSQYGGKNIRYKYQLKREYINKFLEIHNEIIPWNKIRYIF